MFISDLEKAKEFFDRAKPKVEDFLRENFESYLNDFEEYMESIQKAESLEELCEVLNK